MFETIIILMTLGTVIAMVVGAGMALRVIAHRERIELDQLQGGDSHG